MLWLKGKNPDTMKFQVEQCKWDNNLTVEELRDIDDPKFPFSHRPSNLLLDREITYSPLQKEVALLRGFLLDWLPRQSQGLP
jgi:hypothetical protein